MAIIDSVNDYREWMEFLNYKQNNNSLTQNEEKSITEFIVGERYRDYYQLIKNSAFPSDYPQKIIVNKEGTNKKRIVYSFSEEENIVLKFIAYKLYHFDDIFSKGCYAFRRGYGVRDAIRKFRGNKIYAHKYCYKADISNYFNSISVELLLDKLSFVKENDRLLYDLFEKILKEDKVYENKKIVKECHGAMAGTPCSPFFANVYLSDMDWEFENNGIEYFRYSDDVLIFADTEAELADYMRRFHDILERNRLSINCEKVSITEPGQTFEFLGFSYDNGSIDLSANTMRKLKAKIKRKADALTRWQRSKGLTTEKAAIGFINAMNRKFYGDSHKAWDEDDFTWCRWFFPNITTDKSLKIIDNYMLQYIRYIITGRHYKGNYRISYEKIKDWGYRSLVHEYFQWKRDK